MLPGPFNAGKTQFISTVSDIDVVSTERKITTEDSGIKAETTVAMDYGRVEIDGITLHLHGTPGQARFDFMWEILTEEMHGFIVLVDSTDPISFGDARYLMTIFRQTRDVPFLLAASKQDMEGALLASGSAKPSRSRAGCAGYALRGDAENQRAASATSDDWPYQWLLDIGAVWNNLTGSETGRSLISH